MTASLQSLQPLFAVSDEAKRDLLSRLGVDMSLADVLELPQDRQMPVLLQLARVHVLSKAELYFLQDPLDMRHPISLRNEAAAVSLLLMYLSLPAGGVLPADEPDAAAGKATLLRGLLAYCEGLWPEFASGDLALSATAVAPPAAPPPPGSAAARFEAWAAERGIGAAIGLAGFGGLRGCAALWDVAPGDKVLSIPKEALIFEDTVAQSDLGRMLMAIPGLSIDNLLIIFTMVDRHDPDSGWAPFWPSLPDKYYTGLSFPEQLVAALAGTQAGLELAHAQAHVRAQYAATRPLFDMLLQAYPDDLWPEWFDYESYLWSAELWYSYAFDIEFPDSEEGAAGGGSSSGAGGPGAGAAGGACGGYEARPGSKPVMVPFACHVNHSPWPHVVRYGRVNPATGRLDYPAFRPCPKGQQVYISYGPVPNLKLLCYYGFALPSNPHDEVALKLELPDGPLRARQAVLLQALEVPLDHSLRDGPLARQLLACLRVVAATEEELAQMEAGLPAEQRPQQPARQQAQRGGRSKKQGGDRGKGSGGAAPRAPASAAPNGALGSNAAHTVWSEAPPLGRPLNSDNEREALRTLAAALGQLLEPLTNSALLHEEEEEGEQQQQGEQQRGQGAEERQQPQQQRSEQLAEQPGEEAAAQGAEAGGTGGEAHQQAGQRHQRLEGGEGGQQRQQVNENGFDVDWRASRHFCRVYLVGQRAIVERALAECRRVAVALPAA